MSGGEKGESKEGGSKGTREKHKRQRRENV